MQVQHLPVHLFRCLNKGPGTSGIKLAAGVTRTLYPSCYFHATGIPLTCGLRRPRLTLHLRRQGISGIKWAQQQKEVGATCWSHTALICYHRALTEHKSRCRVRRQHQMAAAAQVSTFCTTVAMSSHPLGHIGRFEAILFPCCHRKRSFWQGFNQ